MKLSARLSGIPGGAPSRQYANMIHGRGSGSVLNAGCSPSVTVLRRSLFFVVQLAVTAKGTRQSQRS